MNALPRRKRRNNCTKSQYAKNRVAVNLRVCVRQNIWQSVRAARVIKKEPLRIAGEYLVFIESHMFISFFHHQCGR